MSTKRHQFSSCDPCRHSKRRCEPVNRESPECDAICSNCLRLRLDCTYHYVASRKLAIKTRINERNAQRRQQSAINTSTATASETAYSDRLLPLAYNGYSSEQPSDPLGGPLLEVDRDELVVDFNDDLPRNDCLDLALLLEPSAQIDPFFDFNEVTESNTSHQNMSMPELSADIDPLFNFLDETVASHVDNQMAGSENPDEERNGDFLEVSRKTPEFSLRSPMELLNHRFEGDVLDGQLCRIYNYIMSISAASYLGHGCNLFAKKRYTLEGGVLTGALARKADNVTGDNRITDSSPSSSESTFTYKQQELSELTLLGAVELLDHFGALYGNRIDKFDKQRANKALNDAFHAFSSQWMNRNDDCGFASATMQNTSSDDLYFNCWIRARSSLHLSRNVRSFKTVYAMLLFNMTTVPTQFSSCPDAGDQHIFLREAISYLSSLRRLVMSYCEILGSESTYAGLLQVSMGIISWLALLRDTMTWVTSLGPALFGELPFAFETGLGANQLPSPTAGSLSDKSESEIFNSCQAAISSMIYLWRQLHPQLWDVIRYKSAAITAPPSLIDQTQSVDAILGSLDEYELQYHRLMRFCLKSHSLFSIRTKFLSATWIVFWNYGLLRYADGLEQIPTSDSASFVPSLQALLRSRIQQIRWTSAQSIAAIGVQGVLQSSKSPSIELSFDPERTCFSSPSRKEDTTNPILSVHASSGLIVNALEKAAKSLIAMRLPPKTSLDSLHGPFMGLGINDDPQLVWSRNLRMLIECLVSLQSVPSTSQPATVAMQGLLCNHGDLLSECWSSEF